MSEERKAHPADGIVGHDGERWDQSCDAMAWARAFVAIHPSNGLDEGDMVGWFANAMMRMHDTVLSRPAGEDTSDGYHSFRELYQHRHALFLYALATSEPENEPWYTLEHEDGSMFEGFFLAGMDVRIGKDRDMGWERVTYHLPVEHLDLVETLDHVEKLMCAPPFDGHTSADVVERLLKSVRTAWGAE